jgi:FkbM family methyltransferase
MSIKRFKGKFFAAWDIITSQMLPSFSQAGEDKIIHYLLSQYLKIEKPVYLDIGANHPILFNNTYLFYTRGGEGVCLEPDPVYYKLLRKYRKNDVILQAGVGVGGKGKSDFYVFPGRQAAWNTFSKVEADRRQQESGISFRVHQAELLDINEIISDHLKRVPDLLSVDAEGIDFDIIKSLDLQKFPPKVICVETISFTTLGKPVKDTKVSDYLLSEGYYIFADTHINSIFCRQDLFPNNI